MCKRASHSDSAIGRLYQKDEKFTLRFAGFSDRQRAWLHGYANGEASFYVRQFDFDTLRRSAYFEVQ